MSEPSSLSRLDGKVALITGAAQGIGEATARLFVERGIRGLLLTDRNADRGQDVAKSMAHIAKFVAADLQHASAVEQLVPAALAEFGRIDIVCNIAASTERGTILNTDLALFDRIFAINVRAPFFLMQAAAKAMRKQGDGGAIVNISSVNAHGGGVILSPYSASKAALVNLSKNTAAALVWDRIRVNCILPGWVDTPGEHATLKQFHNAPDNWLEEAEKKRPFGRLVKPDELARAIAYLCSGESGLMTGAVVDFEQGAPGAFPLQAPLED
jgi:NAD(P)-dependent dehydrogenase (short-subunit alcohol dehydrogenase family)